MLNPHLMVSYYRTWNTISRQMDYVNIISYKNRMRQLYERDNTLHGWTMLRKLIFQAILLCHIKDARSVSVYPYNRSNIWQYINYATQINIANGIAKQLPEPGIEPGTSCIQNWCVTTAPLSQLRVSIVVKQFNCFDAMGWKVNKQAEFAGHTFSTNSFFSVIFYMHE